MVIDTIFMCFCEDCNLNDGVTQEYYMSKELMVGQIIISVYIPILIILL